MYGKNEYLYTSVLAYGTKKFLSCDDLVTVMGAGTGITYVLQVNQRLKVNLLEVCSLYSVTV